MKNTAVEQDSIMEQSSVACNKTTQPCSQYVPIDVNRVIDEFKKSMLRRMSCTFTVMWMMKLLL